MRQNALTPLRDPLAG